ncbi:unnamed protein product [Lactuca saligna]|uniref:PB1-like domain-containing protein n=1 Tax=Lactuca saligna TaxID=75948 RepID=A0AA35YNE8_LACSI|nr:unnamed protein product [Lactuca saligna]
MEEIDVEKHYAGHPTIFSIRFFYGGEFTKFPGRKYIKGNERYVYLLDIDEFCVHHIDEMMETLGCVEEGKLLYYHFKRPFSDLDFGLFALASDSEINHLGTYMGKHKLIEFYVEHEPEGITHESNNRDDDDDDSNASDDIGDSEFIVDLDNLLDEPEIDMNEFLLHIDEDIE